MKTINTTLAAAILSLIAFAGNSFAQTPTPSPTPPLSPSAALTGSANALSAARDWTDEEALALPLVTGSYVYTPAQVGLTNAQLLLNRAIEIVTSSTGNIAGAQAAHDYAISKGDYGQAASYSAGNVMRNPAQAVTEQTTANNLMAPCSPEFAVVLFGYETLAGRNVNAAIVSYIQSLTHTVSVSTANRFYGAFNPIIASKTDLLAFYELLLQSVESNTVNAPFIGKILDQENKLNKAQ